MTTMSDEVKTLTLKPPEAPPPKPSSKQMLQLNVPPGLKTWESWRSSDSANRRQMSEDITLRSFLSTILLGSGDQSGKDQQHQLSQQHELSQQTTGSTYRQTRDHWYGKLDCIACLTAGVVGIGNLTHFPSLALIHGKGGFLFPYIILNVFLGLPVFYLEACLGQMTGQSAVVGWTMTPLFKGIGLSILVTSSLLSVVYSANTVLPLLFFGRSFAAHPPWNMCDNHWNSPDCCELSHFGRNNSCEQLHKGSSFKSTEQFYQYHVLGTDQTQLFNIEKICWLLGVWLITFIALLRGIRLMAKLMFFFVFMMFMVVVVLIAQNLTTETDRSGFDFFLVPNIKNWLESQVWLDAGAEVCYGILVGSGCIFTLCSYTRYNGGDPFKVAVTVVLMDFLASVLGGCLFFAHTTNISSMDAQTRKASYRLAYLTYPESISSTKYASFLALLFFSALSGLGITSQIALVHVVSTFVLDSVQLHITPKVTTNINKIPKGLLKRSAVVGALCLVGYLLAIPFTFPGSHVWMGTVSGISFMCMLVNTLLEVVIIAWVFGLENFNNEMKTMLGPLAQDRLSSKRYVFVQMCWKYIIPFCIAIILIWTLVDVSSGYEGYIRLVGLIIPVTIVIIFAIYQVFRLRARQSETSKFETVRQLLRPASEWRLVLANRRISRSESEEAFSVKGEMSKTSHRFNVSRMTNDKMDKLALISSNSGLSVNELYARQARMQKKISTSNRSYQGNEVPGVVKEEEEEEADDDEEGSIDSSSSSSGSNSSASARRRKRSFHVGKHPVKHPTSGAQSGRSSIAGSLGGMSSLGKTVAGSLGSGSQKLKLKAGLATTMCSSTACLAPCTSTQLSTVNEMPGDDATLTTRGQSAHPRK